MPEKLVHLLCVMILLAGAIDRYAAGQLPSTVKETCTPLQDIRKLSVGQKAWNQCVETSQRVYPCDAASGTRATTCAHIAVPLILGRSRAEPGEFPHMAFLGYGELPNILWNCGGSLISDKWILTAGHCIFDRSTGTDVTHVRLGGGDLNSTIDPADYFTVTKIVSHPGCDWNNRYDDIALLQLDRLVTFTKSVHPGCLHAGQLVNDAKSVATGWGVIKANTPRSNSLNKAVIEKFTFEECSKLYSPEKTLKDGVRNDTQFCAGPRNGLADIICQGDAGGPLQVYNPDVYCSYLIIGITSFGKPCGIPGFPTVYTRVSTFIPWIESVVWP